MKSWYKQPSDIAVSTRIRIARNLKGVPFPHKMTTAQIKSVCESIKEALTDVEFKVGKLHYIPMESVADEAAAMVERHIISPDFAANPEGRALLLSDDESVSIMLCEEDHIRIQVLFSGKDLFGAYDVASEIDRVICEKLEIAFHPQLGFLTECPTNLGTGLRASVMLHLPVLESLGGINAVSESVSKIGLTVRGLYGEGSNSAASLYQLSNQVTLGLTEEQALKNLDGIANQIIEQEKNARNEIPKEQLEDSVCRAFGILKEARILSSEEMMNLLSRLKLGITEGIIKNVDKSLPMELLIEAQPYMLQKLNGRMTPSDRDILRAKLCREKLRGSE